MTALQTIESNSGAKALYNCVYPQFEVSVTPLTDKINDTRKYYAVRRIYYNRPFPWLFMPRKKKLGRNLLPYYLHNDSLAAAQEWLAEFILFTGGYFFDTKRYWFLQYSPID